MTDGSLKLKLTEWISRSYEEMTSTFPWHHRVMAFCQCTTLRGSYVALSRSVCSIKPESFCLMGFGVSKGWRVRAAGPIMETPHVPAASPVDRDSYGDRRGGVCIDRGDAPSLP